MVNKKKSIFAMIMVALCFVFISACSSESKMEETFDSFKEKFVNQDYEGVYELLSADSQERISKEDFVTRYANVYGGIGASNINIERGELDSETDTFSFTLTMDTSAGEVSFDDFQLPLVEEEGEYKIVWGESLIFPSMIEGDKVRVTSESSTRGSILDRDGNVLAKDGTLSTVGIHPSVFDASNREEKITEIAETLDISESVITEKLDANANPDHFVAIVNILPDDEKLESLVGRDAEGILINNTSSRVYVNSQAFGRLLGFVGSITAEELEANEGKGYTNSSIIGKAGLEQVHEATLRGIDGVEIYIERDGANFETIAKKEAQDGEDIQLSIDSELQEKIYSEMNGEKGSASAVDPTTGEILALVSSPSYNANRFTTYVTRTEQKAREANNFADEKNRFSKLYSPGSTFKLITAAAGLEKGTLDPDEELSIDGRSWQKDSTWGNYSITRVNSQSSVNLNTAMKYSDNIYFARAALDMGSDALIEGAKKFGIGEELNVGFPMNTSQMSNAGTIENDILLADSGYGQGEIMVTSLNMALAYSSLSNDGNIMMPSLIMTDNQEATVWKESAISSDHLSILQDACLAVVDEEGGTAYSSRISGLRIAGKTGTAEIKASQDDEDGSENGWFVATDLDSSKISIAMVIEGVEGRGGSGVVTPKVMSIMEKYLK